MTRRTLKPATFESLLALQKSPVDSVDAEPSAHRSSQPPVSGQPTYAFAKRLCSELLESYLRWCPPELSPSLSHAAPTREIYGSLDLRMKMISGLGALWDLAGLSGYFALEVVSITADASVQYLTGAALTVGGDTQSREVDLELLWRLFQPFYSPHFDADPDGLAGVPNEINLSLDSVLSRRATALASNIAEYIVTTRREELKAELDRLCQRRDYIDSRRRESRPGSHREPHKWANLRCVAREIESQIQEKEETLATLTAPSASVVRQRVCLVRWKVSRP